MYGAWCKFKEEHPLPLGWSPPQREHLKCSRYWLNKYLMPEAKVGEQLDPVWDLTVHFYSWSPFHSASLSGYMYRIHLLWTYWLSCVSLLTSKAYKSLLNELVTLCDDLKGNKSVSLIQNLVSLSQMQLCNLYDGLSPPGGHFRSLHVRNQQRPTWIYFNNKSFINNVKWAITALTAVPSLCLKHSWSLISQTPAALCLHWLLQTEEDPPCLHPPTHSVLTISNFEKNSESIRREYVLYIYIILMSQFILGYHVQIISFWILYYIPLWSWKVGYRFFVYGRLN